MKKGSEGYISEVERFETDFAVEEKRKRDDKLNLARARVEYQRIAHAQKEDHRWKRHEKEAVADEEKFDRWRESGEKARRNKSSVPYNPLTLRYDDTPDGDMLKAADMACLKRAELRRRMLRVRMSNLPYDPITHKEVGEIAKYQAPPLH